MDNCKIGIRVTRISNLNIKIKIFLNDFNYLTYERVFIGIIATFLTIIIKDVGVLVNSKSHFKTNLDIRKNYQVPCIAPKIPITQMQRNVKLLLAGIENKKSIDLF